MKYSSTIKINALSLLIIFSLNMLIGFACSLGVDMGYNTDHHQVASGKATDNIPSCHMDNSDSGASKQQSELPGTKDCCSGGVIEFLKMDKNASSLSAVDVTTPVLLLAHRFSYQLELLQYFENTSLRSHQLMRSDHPPQKDVRTAIHSFLI